MTRKENKVFGGLLFLASGISMILWLILHQLFIFPTGPDIWLTINVVIAISGIHYLIEARYTPR